MVEAVVRVRVWGLLGLGITMAPGHRRGGGLQRTDSGGGAADSEGEAGRGEDPHGIRKSRGGWWAGGVLATDGGGGSGGRVLTGKEGPGSHGEKKKKKGEEQPTVI
jgi:hypothetical protein